MCGSYVSYVFARVDPLYKTVLTQGSIQYTTTLTVWIFHFRAAYYRLHSVSRAVLMGY